MIEPISVRERGRIELPDAIVDAVPSQFWTTADCKVTKSSGNEHWVLEAGDSVGIARVPTRLGNLTLQIAPKLETADVFFLADYAYEQRHNPLNLLDHDIGLDTDLRDPTAGLLVWHARAIHRFAARWLRRDYHTTDTLFEGKTRGRFLVSQYVARQLATGHGTSVPCRVHERTQDTPNNRLLKAGLRFIASLSQSMPTEPAQRAVLRAAKAALPLFAQVSDVAPSLQLMRKTTSRGAQRHYGPILASTTAMLRGQLMSGEAAPVANTTAFMWRMPVLFQEALRGVIDSAPGLTLDADTVGRSIVQDSGGRGLRSSKVDPDLVLRKGSGTAVLIDTKYKDALPGGNVPPDEGVTVVAGRVRLKVSRADVYQMVAYLDHIKWPQSIGALLFPIVLTEGEQLPEPMKIVGFGHSVWLLFIDIGPNAPRHLPSFIASVNGFVDGCPPTPLSSGVAPTAP